MSALSHPPPPSKQLRFVNNAGEPPSKRRRINIACLNCRKRKTRCAGERPVCSTCTTIGQACLGYKQAQTVSEDARHHTRTGDLGNDNDDDDNDKSPATQTSEAGSDTTPRRRASEVGPRSNATNHGANPLRRRRVSANELSHCHPQNNQNNQNQECEVGQKSPQQCRKRKWEHARDGSQEAHAQRVDYRRRVSFQGSSHESHDSPRQHPPQHESHRVPYFRYFGPTAIVPGYKQMVVNVSSTDRRRSHGSNSFSISSPDGTFGMPLDGLQELPIYDPNDADPIHPIIINLVKTFFLHLGCNFPFLREQRVLQQIQDKHMEPILVDAMCALAARFSDLFIFGSGHDDDDNDKKTPRPAYGALYAQRAKAATVDTFPCPSVAAVQACLLMAYEGFGADQDSALWMYLGIAIRMALDLGLQKNISVDAAQGGSDLLFIRANGAGASTSKQQHGCHTTDTDNRDVDCTADRQGISSDARRADEQERANTFWAVFFLDRVISSGTGRPVTFRDDDFDLAFPEPVLDPVTKRPAPFPILAQIIHLYGRVSDVLNNIQSVDDLTLDKMKRLGHMERDLTQLYQQQDARLNFDVPNFQAYVCAGQGTTFILLHFWFHALIIILHQPTLLTPFGRLHRRHQLLPNSHELSMSSAKTIADILSCVELIDPKSFVGNPFTSQPMYIAACAFLTAGTGAAGTAATAKTANANQNYQRCYTSLQQLHRYWGGVRYILSALDQKAKGIWDCETFTREEMDSTSTSTCTKIPPLNPGPSAPPIAWSLTGTFNSANPSLTVLFQSHANTEQRQQRQQQQEQNQQQQRQQEQRQQEQNQQQQHQQQQQEQPQLDSAATPPGNMVYDPVRQNLVEIPLMPATAYPQAVGYPQPQPAPTATAQLQQVHYNQLHHVVLDNASARAPEAAIYGSSAYQHQQQQHQQQHQHQQLHGYVQQQHAMQGQMQPPRPAPIQSAVFESGLDAPPPLQPGVGLAPGDPYAYLETGPMPGVITFDSQEVDISHVPPLLTDIMPQWLEYLPSNVLDLFGDQRVL